MISLAMLITAHGRHDLAKAVLRHTAGLRDALRPEIALDVMIAMSRTDVSGIVPVCEGLGFARIVKENEPVSRKHQAGLEAIRKRFPSCQGVVLGASDDFFSAEYLRLIAGYAAAGKSAGPDRVYILDEATGTMGLWDKPFILRTGLRIPVGPGRLFGRRLLEAVEWQVWPFDANCALDTLSAEHLERRGQRLLIVELGDKPWAVTLDVKPAGGPSITSWQRLIECGMPRVTPARKAEVLSALGETGRQAYLRAASAPIDAGDGSLRVRLTHHLLGVVTGLRGEITELPIRSAYRLIVNGMAAECPAGDA